MRISDWSSDVCSSDLRAAEPDVAQVFDADGHHALLQAMTRTELPQTALHDACEHARSHGQQPVVEAEGRVVAHGAVHAQEQIEIGRASCRERVCQYV